jgi:hypothetical protein
VLIDLVYGMIDPRVAEELDRGRGPA